MAGTKISVSLDQPLAKKIRREARAAHRKVSTWIADVVREHLRQKEAKAVLDDVLATRGPVPRELEDEVRRQWPRKD